VLASKLLFILDDLLWVLTDSQLKAIIHYAKSLSEAMEKSAQQRKNMTAESLQVFTPSCCDLIHYVVDRNVYLRLFTCKLSYYQYIFL